MRNVKSEIQHTPWESDDLFGERMTATANAYSAFDIRHSVFRIPIFQ
jgi:hypothetical protein